jgi:hypothetical protein
VAKIEVVDFGELFLRVSGDLIQVFEQRTNQKNANAHATASSTLSIDVFGGVGVWGGV